MPLGNRILLEQRQKIIEDFSEDYLTAVATIGLNLSTARGKRREAHHFRVNDEMGNCLNDIVNENYEANLMIKELFILRNKGRSVTRT